MPTKDEISLILVSVDKYYSIKTESQVGALQKSMSKRWIFIFLAISVFRKNF